MGFDRIDAQLQWCLAPELVFTPPLLDFGQLQPNCKKVVELYVTNLSGPIDGCSVVCLSERAWFRLVHVQGMHSEQGGCVKILVEANTQGLAVKQCYIGQLEVRIEQVYTQVPLTIEVIKADAAVAKRWRLRHSLAMTLITAILVSVCLSFSLPEKLVALSERLLPELLTLRPWSDPNVVAFAADDGGIVTLYVADVMTAHPQTLGIAGWSPVWSPDGMQLAFLSDQSGAAQLYVLQEVDASVTPLTDSPEPKSLPVWAPDGSKLAFLTGAPDQGLLQIVDNPTFVWSSATPALVSTVALRTSAKRFFSKQTQLGKPGFIRHFAWAPNSRTLLFDYYQGNQVQIFHLSAEGVTLVARNSWHPTWAPDGKTIAAVSSNGLFRTALDGTQRHWLSRRQAHAPAWVSNGQGIAFLAPPAARNGASHNGFDLWLIDANGKHETLLVAGCVTFAWSPDGKRLAYVTGDGAGPSPLFYLWTRRIDDTAASLLAELKTPAITWHPLP